MVELPSTLKMFLEWLISAAGLGVIVVFIVQFAKEKLGWEDLYARLLAIGVSLVVGVGATLLLQYELYVYAEEWWPLLVAILLASGLTYGGSQLLYNKLPTKNGS